MQGFSMSSTSHSHEAASHTSAERSSHQQSPEVNSEQEILPDLSPIAEIKQRQNVLTAGQTLQLQRAIGNRATARMITSAAPSSGMGRLSPQRQPHIQHHAASTAIQRGPVKDKFIESTSTGMWFWKKRLQDEPIAQIDALLDQYEKALEDGDFQSQLTALSQVKDLADAGIPEEFKKAFGAGKPTQLVQAMKDIKKVATDLILPLRSKIEKPVEITGEKFIAKYSRAQNLVKGINPDDSADTKLRTLLANFLTEPFEYSMRHGNWEDWLRGGTDGDCKTLADAFAHIAMDGLGVVGVKAVGIETLFFVAGGGAVKDTNNAVGNVNAGSHWFFTSHYWVETPIGNYDLLFRGQPLDKSKWDYLKQPPTRLDKSGDVEEHHFSNFDQPVYDYIKAGGLSNRYTTNRTLALEHAGIKE
jgi:hypothetical protein